MWIATRVAVACHSLHRYIERLTEVGIEPLVGGIGDSCEHLLTETINGRCKAGRGPWLVPMGYIAPAEAEANYQLQLGSQAVAA